MKIIRVKTNSLAGKIGLKPGDRLLKINGKKVLDEIDYKFRFTEENLILDLEINGQLDKVEISKEYDEGLGVQFEEMKIRKCANDCVFCFVDQNPEGMRGGMYFRDGDYRMSYLFGHYITMTNMGNNELNRIIEQKMSPLYISVHVTDKELRKKLFLYKKDDNLLEKLSLLANNDIELHTQIVLMPDINDGKYLLQTLSDLYRFHPKLNSCTIVPVGLTEHRTGLMEIPLVTKEYAIKLLNQLPELQKKFPGHDSGYVLFSDEWYILANKSFPNINEYGGVNLVENGVGQVATFLNNFYDESLSFPISLRKFKKVTIVTGILIADIFKTKILPVLKKINDLIVDIIPIENNFYGHSVTVTGLLTGKDIIHQLKGKDLGDEVWVSHRILNDEGICTLDDMTLDEISNELGCNVRVSQDSFKILLESIDFG
jgi:putative radical SAM enzyme (TIGR03279 family)